MSLKLRPIFSNFLSESASALFRKVVALFLSFPKSTHLLKFEVYSPSYGPKTWTGSDRQSSLIVTTSLPFLTIKIASSHVQPFIEVVEVALKV